MSASATERHGSVAYAFRLVLDRPIVETIEATREALAEQGFGVLTEIDVRATMKAKLGVEVPAQVILGACNPSLAYSALEEEPSLGLLLPCNVTVREGPVGTIVEVIDPTILVTFAQNPALEPIAAEAARSLVSMLETLERDSEREPTR